MIHTQRSQEIAISYKDQAISYDQLRDQILSYATLLEGKSIDKVAIFSENLPEWIYAFYATLQHDITVVPIDFMASAEDVAYILDDCKPGFVFHSSNTENVLKEALESTNHKVETFCFGSQDLPQVSGEIAKPKDYEKTAVIIYTSGTTGSPKGVMLSYTNLLTNVTAVCEDVPIYNKDSRVLLILPLQHIFPLLGAMMAPLYVGGLIAIAPSLQAADIIETLKKNKITLIIGVPRLYDLIYKGVLGKINASPITKGLYKLIRRINSPKLGKVVFKKVHEGFGGHLKTLVSGGAALPMEVGGFYHSLGFDVLEGYGMTESAPMISFTRPGDVIIGCAGKTMSCLEVEIRDGEVVAKGKSIMKGYYNRPEETAEVIKDGWLHTGDLGYLDKESRLYITGRKKEIIVLPSGKNINPVELEERIMSKLDDLILEVGVILHEDVLHAVILPNFKALSNKGITDATEEFNNFFIHRFNPKVSPSKKISKCTVVKTELPRTRLSKLQRFKLAEMINTGKQEKTRKPEPQNEEYKSLKKFLEDLTGKDVYADQHLAFDLALDSLAKLELRDYIERTFGLKIKDEELLNFSSVAHVAGFIASHKTQFNDEDFDWHEMLTHPIEIKLRKPSWTFTLFNFKAKLIFKTLFKIKQRGLKEHQPGAGILVANHASFLDGFLVASLLCKDTLKDTFFYAKKEHFNTPLRRWLANRNNIIIVDLEKNLYESIQQLAQLLREGKKLIIFPEGTRTNSGKLGVFKPTYAILSKVLNIPIYPIAISGAYEAWPRHRKSPIFNSTIKVNFLEAIMPGDMDDQELNKTVRDTIKKAITTTQSKNSQAN